MWAVASPSCRSTEPAAVSIRAWPWLTGCALPGIAPSRFGYLGAPIPERTDALAQAGGFAELLDQLAVDCVIVMGASAGAITALAFAERYPERTAALLLMVPAYYPPERAAPAPWSPIRTWAVSTALRSDFLFWAGMRQ
jgi:2-hydroxy-6-oxonona-2,4-dienedioate hydrolase